MGFHRCTGLVYRIEYMDERVFFLSFWFWPTKAKSDFLLALLRDNPTLISKKKKQKRVGQKQH